jgi:iron complex outermembrane recepter protein
MLTRHRNSASATLPPRLPTLLATFLCASLLCGLLLPTAAMAETPVTKLPVGTIVITRSMIQSSAATNTAALLDSVAGINVRRDYGIAGSSTDVDLLGFGARGNDNTLVLLNGRRINNIDNNRLNLANIALSAIERIEILPGSGSVLYGEGAAAGAINIITHHDNNDSTDMQESANGVNASASATGGEYNTAGGDVQASFQRNNTYGSASWHALDSDGFRHNNATRQRSGVADIHQGFGHNRVYLSVIADEQRTGLPGSRNVVPGSLNQFKQDPDGTNTPNDWDQRTQLQVMPGMELRLQPNLYFSLDGNFSSADKQRFIEANNYTDADITRHGVNPRVHGTLAVGFSVHQWTLGYDHENLSADTDVAASPAAPTSSLSKGDRRRNAWYLQDTISFSEQLSVTLGARQSRFNTRYRSAALNEKMDDRVEMFQTGVQFRPVPQLALFANAERSARLANFDELSNAAGTLKPQTGVLVSSGASWTRGAQHSVLTLWRGKFEDELMFDPLAGPLNNGATVNLDDKTLRQGLSLNSRWQLDEQLAITLNGSLQKAQFHDGANRGNNIPLVPHKTAYIQADWQAQPWLLLTLSQRYVGSRKLDTDNGNNFSSLSPYTWTDLSTTFSYRKAWLKLGVYNLTDTLVTDYGLSSGAGNYETLPLPDRHVLATFGMTL